MGLTTKTGEGTWGAMGKPLSWAQLSYLPVTYLQTYLPQLPPLQTPNLNRNTECFIHDNIQ